MEIIIKSLLAREINMDKNTQVAVQTYWDYIIIGTGMGGSVLGLSLAKAGKKVLFCEKGLSFEKLKATSNFPEMSKDKITLDNLKKSGRRFAPIFDLSFNKSHEFVPFLGEGAGGSSLLYGMAMERGRPEDFNSWPVSYDEMKLFYDEAEILFGVAPSKVLHPQNKVVQEFLMAKGLHPYKLPLASQQNPECPGCQGHLCNHNSKNHAGNRALAEALKYPGVMLLDECNAQSLTIETNKVSEVIIKRNLQSFSLKSERIVLAAGALETPRILFRSQSPLCPSGAANSSDQVGKNLMRHLIDLYVVDAKSLETNGATKQIAFNDFYHLQEGKGGTVQSFGKMPPIKMILQDIFRDISFHSKIASSIAQLFAPFLGYFLKNIFSQSIVLASIVEDSPCESNRVLNTTDQTSFIYKVQNADKNRLDGMRRKMHEALKEKLKMKIYGGEKNTLLGHACGTCRMGLDPKNSVVNKEGRTHDLENLYIVDSSVFPTSLGVNPSLTIVANALRIAKGLVS